MSMRRAERIDEHDMPIDERYPMRKRSAEVDFAFDEVV